MRDPGKVTVDYPSVPLTQTPSLIPSATADLAGRALFTLYPIPGRLNYQIPIEHSSFLHAGKPFRCLAYSPLPK